MAAAGDGSSYQAHERQSSEPKTKQSPETATARSARAVRAVHHLLTCSPSQFPGASKAPSSGSDDEVCGFRRGGERLKARIVSVSTFQLSSVQAAAVAELLRIARVADRLGELFSNAGHELYLVGGSVRDALLGRWTRSDFATSARPMGRRSRFGGSTAVWTIGKEFGTIGRKVDAGDASWIIEVTTYRSMSTPGTA